MSDQDGVPASTSDLELDLILQTASNDLAEGIARVTDVAAGAQAIASREAAPPCMSDTELDAALDSADADLITSLGRVIDTQTRFNAIIADSYEQAKKRHPATRR